MPTTVTMTGPGTTTIVNDAAAAITAQTAALTAELVFIDSDLFQINVNVAKLVDQAKVSAKALSDLQVSIAGLSAATSNAAVIQAAAASNQIQTNNFQVAATKATLEATGQPVPAMPPIVDQMKTVVTDSMVLNAAATAEGAITNFIQTQAAAAQTWLVGTEVYKDVASWFKKQKDILVAAVFPPSADTAESAAKAASGIKSI
jgi:cell division protein FtsL